MLTGKGDYILKKPFLWKYRGGRHALTSRTAAPVTEVNAYRHMGGIIASYIRWNVVEYIMLLGKKELARN